MFSYDKWAAEQAEKVRSAVTRLAMGGIFDAAVYCVPARGAVAGELMVSTAPQALEVLHFTGHGTRVAGIAHSQLPRAVWEACRRLPVCPVTL